MPDYLYYLFIAPLEWIMRTVLEAGCASFGTYGAALVFMSIVVNVMLLPLYHLAETWQESERRVQHAMESQLARIKRTFKGRERFMLIATLYRQHEYHPVYAVRTSFGFLIQVPFFFAAYHFLSHYTPLNGASFWIFDDLAKPDGLLSVAGLPVNVLPILMTVINIVSALVYTNRLRFKDKLQLYVMAALFLVLLYTAPSGLVFYWTCNNIFSLLKNMVYEELGIFSHGESTKGKTRAAMALEAAGRRLEGLITKKTALAAGAIGFLSLAVLWAGQAALVQDESVLLQGARVCLLTVLCAGLLALLGRVLAGHASLYLWAVSLVMVLAAWQAGFPALPQALLLLFFFFALMPDEVMLPHVPDHESHPGYLARAQAFFGRLARKDLTGIAARALFVLALTVFWAVPLSLMAKDADLVSAQSLALLTLYSLLVIAFPFSLLKTGRGPLCFYLTVVVTSTALLAMLYTYVLQIDYGVLDAFMLQSEEDVQRPWYVLCDIPVILAVTAFVVVLIFRKRQVLGSVLSVCLLVSLSFSAIYGTRTVLAAKGDDARPVAGQAVIELSRTKPNVLVFMLDMFTGDHVADMYRERPELLKEFDGFTFYPDTISEAAVTAMSLPSIIAGPGVAPRNLAGEEEGKGKGTSLEEKIHAEIASLLAFLEEHNCTFRILSSGDIDFIAGRDYVTDKLTERFEAGPKTKEEEEELEALSGIFLVSYGLFRAAPWSLRHAVYREGDWLVPQDMASLSHTAAIEHTRKHHAVLDSLGSMTVINDEASHYTFISNELTHMPWSVSAETLAPCDTDPCPETEHPLDMLEGRIPEHYYAEMAAISLIGDYLAELKQQKVYDNTVIILVSDHCEGDSQPLSAVFGVDNPSRALENVYPGRPGALLMVKPLGAHGALKTSSSPMASSDVRAIAEAAFLGKAMKHNPDRQRYHALGHWIRERHGENAYILNGLWQIDGSRLDKANWHMLDIR